MNQVGGSLISQFNKLKQIASIYHYIQEFEELRALLKENNQTLNEEYFLESFIGGLKEEVGKLVEIQKPTSLLDATQMALQSEDLVTLLNKGQKLESKSYSTINPMANKNERGDSKPKLLPIKILTPEEMKVRRDKNLCFNCEEAFHIGHKWKWLYLIWMEGEDEAQPDTLELEEIMNDQKEPQISLNALAG